jgi:hypothetical protein
MLPFSIRRVIPLVLPDALLDLAILDRLTSVFVKGGINTPILSYPLSLFFYLGFELFLGK